MCGASGIWLVLRFSCRDRRAGSVQIVSCAPIRGSVSKGGVLDAHVPAGGAYRLLVGRRELRGLHRDQRPESRGPAVPAAWSVTTIATFLISLTPGVNRDEAKQFAVRPG